MVTWGSVTTRTFGKQNPATPTPQVTGGSPASSTFPTTPVSTPTNTPLNSNTSAGSTPGINLFNFSTPNSTTTTQAFPSSGGASSTFSNNSFGTPNTTPGSPSPHMYSNIGGVSTPSTSTKMGLSPSGNASFNPSTSVTSLNMNPPHLQQQQGAQLESALRTLRFAYDPAASVYHHTPSRFQYIFYQPKTDPSFTTQATPGVDLQKWSQAMVLNPDPSKYVPISITTAKELLLRLSQQQENSQKLKDHTINLRNTIEKVLRPALAKSKNQISHSHIERQSLDRRLLSLMKKVEILRCMNLQIQKGEVEAKSRLDSLAKSNVPNTLKLMNEVTDLSNQHSKNQQQVKDIQKQFNAKAFSQEEKRVLYEVMEEQRLGLQALTNILKKEVKDMNVVKKEMETLENRIGLPHFNHDSNM